MKNNEKDVATYLMTLAMSVKIKKKTVVVSGITVLTDKLNNGKNANTLLKLRCKEKKGKNSFADNSNITLGILNYIGFQLN